MNASKLGMCLALALLALPAFAGREAVETSAKELIMPSTPDGTFVLRKCDTCPLISVRVTPQSRYFIGNREVSFQEMMLQAKRPEGMSLVVSFDAKTQELRSIRGWL